MYIYIYIYIYIFEKFCRDGNKCRKYNVNILQNQILLIFKLYIYQSREIGVLNLNGLIKNVIKVKKQHRKLLLYVRKRPFSLIINGPKICYLI